MDLHSKFVLANARADAAAPITAPTNEAGSAENDHQMNHILQSVSEEGDVA